MADPKLPCVSEVASVKPLHKADDQRVMMVAQPGGRFTASTALRLLIRTAYRLQDDQIYGGPSWLTSDLFDIVAKAEDDSASPSQIASMIQAPLPGRPVQAGRPPRDQGASDLCARSRPPRRDARFTAPAERLRAGRHRPSA